MKIVKTIEDLNKIKSNYEGEINIEGEIDVYNFDFKKASINLVSGGSINWVAGGSINRVAGGSINWVSGGSINRVAGGSINLVAGGSINWVAGGSINRVDGGSINWVAGGSINWVAGGSINRVAGGSINWVAGGSINRVSSGSINRVAGGSINWVSGGSINWVAGGSINRVSGGSINRVDGGSINWVSGGSINRVDGNATINIYSENVKIWKITGYATVIFNSCKNKCDRFTETANLIFREKFKHNIETFIDSFDLKITEGYIELLKAVRKDNGKDFHSNSILYEGTVECPDWVDSNDIQCGNGLHLSVSQELALIYVPIEDQEKKNYKFKRCRVKVENIRVYADDISKVRCKQVEVIGDI